jgi:putative transposase
LAATRREGHERVRPRVVAIGVTCAGERDILGLWAGDGAFAKFWLAVVTEINFAGVVWQTRGG